MGRNRTIKIALFAFSGFIVSAVLLFVVLPTVLLYRTPKLMNKLPKNASLSEIISYYWDVARYDESEITVIDGVAYDLDGKKVYGIVVAEKNGTIFHKAFYHNGILQKSEFFNTAGNMVSRSKYADGTMYTYDSFYPNGNIMVKVPYKQTQVNGKMLYYRPDGRLLGEYRYKYGFLYGVSKIYHDNYTVEADFVENVLINSLLIDVNGTKEMTEEMRSTMISTDPWDTMAELRRQVAPAQ